jgi:hypothetical protein
VKDDASYEIELGPEISDGVRIGARRRGGEVELVSLTTMKDGATLAPGSEVIDIEPRDGRYMAKTIYKVPLTGGDGPAQVATPAYRDGWSRVFGKKEVGLA